MPTLRLADLLALTTRKNKDSFLGVQAGTSTNHWVLTSTIYYSGKLTLSVTPGQATALPNHYCIAKEPWHTWVAITHASTASTRGLKRERGAWTSTPRLYFSFPCLVGWIVGFVIRGWFPLPLPSAETRGSNPQTTTKGYLNFPPAPPKQNHSYNSK